VLPPAPFIAPPLPEGRLLPVAVMAGVAAVLSSEQATAQASAKPKAEMSSMQQ
jgi:hypothetical protein